MRIFFCVFLHAHVFLCFFGMRITHMCDAHTKKHKKTQKNMRILEKHTKKYAHQNAHNAHDAQNFVCFSKCAYFFAVFFNAQNFVFFS